MRDGNDSSIRESVFQLLDENHELKPKQICTLLKLKYKKYWNYVGKLRAQWKSYYRNRHALKCLSFHNARGWIYALKSVARATALETEGWVPTRAKNKMIVWVDPKLGRLEWHVTGRVNVWVKKPASLGRAKQLLANAFSFTGLIKDVQIFDLWANTIRFKGAHMVYDTGERLPYSRIDYLKEPLGVVIKTGDVTHPTGIEVEFHYPDWAERNELLFQQLSRFLQQSFPGREQPERSRAPEAPGRDNPFLI